MAGEAEYLAVGRITRAHGVRGEVVVLVLSEIDLRFEPGSRLLLRDPDGTLTVAASRPHRDRLLVSFHEVADRDAAEALRGRYLFVPAGEAPPLPEGEFWPHQVIGAQVVSEDGRSLGTITEIVRSQANDVWVATAGAGRPEVLIPALKDVVVTVDVPGRRVVVREVPGLTGP